MSTLVSGDPAILIKSEEDLQTYFSQFAKARKDRLVGLEAEFFAVNKVTGHALSYSGPEGIEAIFRKLSELFEYETLYEKQSIIALKKNRTMITLEPGGQIELSAAPVKNVFDIQNQIFEFISELKYVETLYPHVAFISVGMQPFSGLSQIEWVPKERYKIMAEFLGKRGRLAHSMMKLTGTNQISYDYIDEEDAMRSLRTVFAITPIVTALFANSSFSEGKPNKFQSKRFQIWQHTDPDRTGILTQFLRPGQSFRDYLKYVLDMPMIFILREGKYVPLEKISFRDFIRDGYEGYEANMNDFELQLSVAFPEVRLKQFIEVRGADAQSPHLIPSVAAFWKGILYCEDAQNEAFKLVENFSVKEREKLNYKVSREGLKAKIGKCLLKDLAKELVNISCHSLSLQKPEGQAQSECLFLKRIENNLILSGQSPADQLLEFWNHSGRDREKLIQYLSI